MRRWNGWGDRDVVYPLPTGAGRFLEERLGPLLPVKDASLAQVLETVPPSRLRPHPLVDEKPETRLRHARGQSLPDWIALRAGRIQAFPDGVANPGSKEEIQDLLAFASRNGARLIPYGGGTSVVGHINPEPGDEPILTVDLGRLNRLLELDPASRLATFQAGVRGPDLESQLHPHGFTLGHYPQSFEYSTLGGWIATRSCGQQSYHYGRIEDLFAGGQLETPRGTLLLPPHPASAAGPDLRELALGSEGRLGFITQAAIRISPLPEAEEFHGVFFKTWLAGLDAVKRAAQEGLPLSMLRLSNPRETEISLQLSGQERLVSLADWGLNTRGYGPDRCLLIFGLTGGRRQVAAARRQAKGLWRSFGGLNAGKLVGETWRKSRFRSPYLRNVLWEKGVALDTLETAVPWVSVRPAAMAILGAIERAGADGEKDLLAFAHVSHVYRTGASIYVTVLMRRPSDPDQLLARWQRMKQAASEAILAHGGTITHQHGIGLDHARYMAREKGSLGVEAIEGACRMVDPEGVMIGRKFRG